MLVVGDDGVGMLISLVDTVVSLVDDDVSIEVWTSSDGS